MRVKLIVTIAGSFGAGVGIGWAFTADYFENRMKSNQVTLGALLERRTNELNATKEILLRSASTVTADEGQNGSDFELIDEPIEILVEDDEAEEEEAFPPGETEEQTRARLQNIINGYTGNETDVETFVDRGAIIVGQEKAPFVISRNKFSWDEEEGDEYDKVTLTYYPQHRMLVEDEDELVDDVENVVGWRNLQQFGFESDDPDVVFVRNQRLNIDYEIVRDTENPPPIHLRHGMGREEYNANKAAGMIRFRAEDV